MVTNQQIRQAITMGFEIDGWQQSDSNGAHNYLDVFEKAYNDKPSIEKVTVTVAEDDNQDGRSIRFYVCMKFATAFPSPNWMSEFWVARPQPDGIPGPQQVRVEQRELQRNAKKSGNAVHAILEDSDWEQLTSQTLNVETLRNCCKGLCKWADAYVATLP